MPPSIPLTSNLAKKAPRIGQGLYYDPLYGYVPVANELRQIIDSEVFQRLRGVKQLSTLYLVFAGAHHTRFEHSIGVSYLSGIAHERLREFLSLDKNNPQLSGLELNKITLIVSQLIGLLHDIGHGPFAHVFEMFCKRNPKYSYWNHEKWGISLITGDTTGFEIDETQEKIFNQIPDLLRNLKRKLSLEFPNSPLLDLLDPTNIARMCFDKPPILKTTELSNNYYFFVDIVTSPYGTDRLDYLRRDAFYTGVKTGDIDIWEILRNLNLCRYGGKIQLFLDPSAGVGMEALIRSRDAVYRKIYHNPVSRSAQELVVRGLVELNEAPEKLAFLGDNDLLDYFKSSNSAFVREVEERLRFRILYELLPICSFMNISRSLDQLDQALKNYTFNKKEKIINENLKLKKEQRVFYDIEQVPSIKEEDITKEIFWGITSKAPKSLVELLPHVKDHFVGNSYNNPTSSKLGDYKNYISKIYVSFPFEYIIDEIENVVSNYSETETIEIEIELENIYKKKLKPLVEGFFTEILNLSKDNLTSYVSVLNEANVNFVAYLRGIIHVKHNLWIKD